MPPGVYVTGLKIDPAQPKFGKDITFIATFRNTTAKDDQAQWFIEIFNRESNKSVGETLVQTITIPPGTHEFSVDGWKLSAEKACVRLYAQAWHLNAENKPVHYVSENGEVISHEFEVCP